ncbi:MAG: M42 family metallopeptidase [Anaerolineaceae bacterium]|nr:M42 family metallopeptidase [Anaerolineaceae bacterium]
MKALIQNLVETFAPSGFEGNVRTIVRAEIEKYVDRIEVDAMGNLIAWKGTKAKDGKRVMLSAHMDEICLFASHIDEKGFVRFSAILGVRPHTCMGGRVRFLNGTRGVIGNERLDDPSKVATFEQMFIDVGATSREDCPVKVGDVAAFDRPFLDLGQRLVAKSMDDRVGVAVLIEVIKQIKESPNELVFVFSTQEEVGMRGATTAAYAVDPEIGISIDVTAVGDTPRGLKMEVALGNGPAIKVRDAGMISDPRLVKLMADTAEKARIPYQMEILEGGTTDARAMQVTRAGMPACCLSIPSRYIHSPSEMVDLGDVQNAVRLMIELLSHPMLLE